MRRIFSGTISIAVLIVGFALCAPLTAAVGISLSPPKFELEVSPGDVISEAVSIANQSSNTIALTVSVQDFVASGEAGQAAFVDAQQNDPSISVSNWIEFPKQNIIINPNTKTVVDFQIRVPEDAEPGGHYGAIFFAPPAGEGQVAVQQRIGSLILVKVSGDIIEEGRLDNFGSFASDVVGEDFAKTGSSFFFRGLPVPLAVRYENLGNIHIKPEGKIEIFNMFGKKVAPVGVQSVLNERGVEIKREIVDYIPLNDGQGNVLANSFRTFREEYRGEPFWFYNEDGTKEIRFKGSPLGIYKAKLTLQGSDGQEIVATSHFLIFPIWKVLGGIALAVVLILIFLKLKKWNDRRLEEKFAKKFGVQK